MDEMVAKQVQPSRTHRAFISPKLYFTPKISFRPLYFWSILVSMRLIVKRTPHSSGHSIELHMRLGLQIMIFFKRQKHPLKAMFQKDWISFHGIINIFISEYQEATKQTYEINVVITSKKKKIQWQSWTVMTAAGIGFHMMLKALECVLRGWYTK